MAGTARLQPAPARREARVTGRPGGSDGTADNYSDDNAKCTDDDGGDGCDAKMVIEKEFTLVSGTAFECEVDRTLDIECTWDAQGQMNLAASANIRATTEGNFLSCKVMDP